MYDYVALEDKVRRSGILSEEELRDFKISLYEKSIFTNRRKVLSEDFDQTIKTKPYYEKISTFIEENKYSIKF